MAASRQTLHRAAGHAAEAEAIDTELEGGTAAAEEALEEGFEFESAGDGLIDFGELAGGEPLPTGADGSVVAETVEEKLDFGKAEAHFGGEANEQDAVNGVAWIAALAAETLGRSEEPAFFIVADGGGVEVGGGGQLADFHVRFPPGGDWPRRPFEGLQRSCGRKRGGKPPQSKAAASPIVSWRKSQAAAAKST